MASIQATRLKKGMLVKMEQDLFRVLELQHVTPGNLRGFVRVKLRNIRNGTLSDQKLRSEDSVERATLDERQMQYLYQDGDDYYFMDTVTFDQNAASYVKLIRAAGADRCQHQLHTASRRQPLCGSDQRRATRPTQRQEPFHAAGKCRSRCAAPRSGRQVEAL